MQCRRLLDYIAEERPHGLTAKHMSGEDVVLAWRVLLEIEPTEITDEHIRFAKALHAVWKTGNCVDRTGTPELQWSFLVRVLSIYGGAQEALQELDSKWHNEAYSEYFTGRSKVPLSVAKGLAREGLEEGLLKLTRLAEDGQFSGMERLYEILAVFFAKQDRVPETRQWFAKCHNQSSPNAGTLRELATFARRNNLQDWAMPIFLKISQNQPGKNMWDVILFAALLLGQSWDKVRILMSHMVDRDGPLSPDVGIINSLLRAAVEMGNREITDDILALAVEKGIRPSPESYVILLDLYITTGESKEAEEAFQRLQFSEPVSRSGNWDLSLEYSAVLNRYLVHLAKQDVPNFKHISEILEQVDNDRYLLGPETTALLCVRFLENDQHFDVMDILSVHSFLYSEAQREVVQNGFLAFCLDPLTSTSRAWNAYQLLEQFFQDTSSERRVSLMHAFFDRKRSDMGTHIFNNMRSHRNAAYRPTFQTYVECLERLAEHPDAEGVTQVYNLLKMDTAVTPNTKLYTALMTAFAASNLPSKAIDFWYEIISSREGPSYATLEAIFFTLEKKSGGAAQARKIWEKLEAMDLEVTPEVFNAYVGATAASASDKELYTLILSMPSVVGTQPDATTLGIAYNALPGQDLQRNFQDWAEGRLASDWAKLLKLGRRLNEYGLCQFKMKRVIRP
ncbi:hypothetical protein N3K66_005092 [Trichothecium roseum]|uniref:Uncharacterized protein n=1 Tax=Trichothecium roseum TaxID=47278 RepID=A0ACC0V4H6_9HYPO|nr:hypothetical protein N3K66_005092 [Trichothecium roseum]